MGPITMYEKSVNSSVKLKLKLLLVDDDQVTADVAKKFIADKYELDWVSNGPDAIAKVKENNYDAFLIDIGLPGKLNGMETTKRLKEINDNSHKPYIAVTAHAMFGDKEHFLKNGLTHYLSKPFSRQKILDLIDEVLGN